MPKGFAFVYLDTDRPSLFDEPSDDSPAFDESSLWIVGAVTE